MFSVAIYKMMEGIEPHLKNVLFAILEEMEKERKQWEESVTKTEFNELKEIVKQIEINIAKLTEAQRRSEQRLTRLEQTVAKLAEAQKQSEQRLTRLEETVSKLIEAQRQSEQRLTKLEQTMAELAEAQKQTEKRLNELAEAQKQTEKELQKLSIALNRTRKEIGGLAKSVSFALENEAYRKLPRFLKQHYGIEVIERLIRTEIEGEEVNVFGKIKRDGREMWLVGEAVLKLDDREKIRWVWDKVELVKEVLGGEVMPIIVTHFAKKDIFNRAQKAGIMVVQSFEWD